MLRLLAPILLAFGLAGAHAAAPALIDRQALVSRHNPVIRKVDCDAPLTVGNGGFAFTPTSPGCRRFPTTITGTASPWRRSRAGAG
jgi:hypothetical protein